MATGLIRRHAARTGTHADATAVGMAPGYGTTLSGWWLSRFPEYLSGLFSGTHRVLCVVRILGESGPRPWPLHFLAKRFDECIDYSQA